MDSFGGLFSQFLEDVVDIISGATDVGNSLVVARHLRIKYTAFLVGGLATSLLYEEGNGDDLVEQVQSGGVSN